MRGGVAPSSNPPSPRTLYPAASAAAEAAANATPAPTPRPSDRPLIPMTCPAARPPVHAVPEVSLPPDPLGHARHAAVQTPHGGEHGARAEHHPAGLGDRGPRLVSHHRGRILRRIFHGTRGERGLLGVGRFSRRRGRVLKGFLNASSSSSAPERPFLRDSYLPGGVQGADQGPEPEAGGGRGGELGRAVVRHEKRGQRLRVGRFPTWTVGFVSHGREADSGRVRETSRVASVGKHGRGRACAPRVTVLPPIGREVFLA